MAPWKLPLIVAGIVVPIVLGFWLGGPAAGVAIGALAAAALLVIAARQRPRGPIGRLPEDGRRHILLVVTRPVDDPAAVRRLLAAASLHGAEEGEVRVLAPARIGFLDRWASDVEGARRRAQENLVTTVAALAKAGVVAEARVGDEDVVQAVEDQLQSFDADEVVLVSDEGEEGKAAEAAATGAGPAAGGGLPPPHAQPSRALSCASHPVGAGPGRGAAGALGLGAPAPASLPARSTSAGTVGAATASRNHSWPASVPAAEGVEEAEQPEDGGEAVQ